MLLKMFINHIIGLDWFSKWCSKLTLWLTDILSASICVVEKAFLLASIRKAILDNLVNIDIFEQKFRHQNTIVYEHV